MSFKHLQKLSNNRFLYNLTNAPTNLSRIYCSEKASKVLLKKAESLEKEVTNEPNKIVLKDGEELKIKVINPDIKEALTEKEKDACVRSRLSKECTHLLQSPPNKMGLDVTNFKNVVKEQHEQKSSNWEDYNFGHVVLKDCKQYGSVVYSEETSDKIKFEDSTGGSAHPSCGSLPSSGGSPVSGSASSLLSGGSPSGGTSPPSGGSPPATGGPTAPSKAATSRIIRQEPGEVIGAWIPVDWWEFFLPKTGVTGFGTLIVTFGTYVCSKEILVMEHNYYNGLSTLLLLAITIKYVGPKFSKYLDKQIDEYESAWQKGRNESKKILEEEILQEKFLQFQAEGQIHLIEAKRENVHLQLEEEYRTRLMHAYTQVKQILDYHVAVASVYMKIQQKNLVQYVQKEVLKSVTPEMQDKLIYYSIENIVEEMERQKITPSTENDPTKGQTPPKGGSDPQSLAPKSEKKPDDKKQTSKPDDSSKKDGKK